MIGFAILLGTASCSTCPDFEDFVLDLECYEQIEYLQCVYNKKWWQFQDCPKWSCDDK